MCWNRGRSGPSCFPSTLPEIYVRARKQEIFANIFKQVSTSYKKQKEKDFLTTKDISFFCRSAPAKSFHCGKPNPTGSKIKTIDHLQSHGYVEWSRRFFAVLKYKTAFSHKPTKTAAPTHLVRELIAVLMLKLVSCVEIFGKSLYLVKWHSFQWFAKFDCKCKRCNNHQW